MTEMYISHIIDVSRLPTIFTKRLKQEKNLDAPHPFARTRAHILQITLILTTHELPAPPAWESDTLPRRYAGDPIE